MKTAPPSNVAVPDAGPGAGRLWLYGSIMLGPLLYFAIRYPLLGNSEQRTDIGKLSRYSPLDFAAFVAALVVLFVCYVLALYESRRLSARQALRPAFGLGAIFAATIVWMYPVNATDVYHYAVRSRLLSSYGANPMAALATSFPADAWTRYASAQWARFPSPYGPLWNLIAAPITYFAGDRMLVALIGFKLLALASLLLGGWAIARALDAGRSLHPATGAIFYLWNPLVLWEAVGNAHNDVVMTLPLLLALLAWARRWDYLVIPLLVLAAMIKYVPVLLIPIAAVALWRRAEDWPARLRLGAWSVVLSLIAVAIGLYPFYDLNAIRTSVAQQGSIIRMSLAAVAQRPLRYFFPDGDTRQMLRLATLVIMFICLGAQVCALWRRPSRFPRVAFELIFVFLVVATWYFNSWYLIWPVALAALLPWGWPAWRIIVWTFAGIMGYAVNIWIEAWWQPGFTRIQEVAVAVMFVPVLIITVAELLDASAGFRGDRGSRAIFPRLRRQPLSDPGGLRHTER